MVFLPSPGLASPVWPDFRVCLLLFWSVPWCAVSGVGSHSHIWVSIVVVVVVPEREGSAMFFRRAVTYLLCYFLTDLASCCILA